MVAIMSLFALIVGFISKPIINFNLMLLVWFPFTFALFLFSISPLLMYYDASNTRYIITSKRLLCSVTGLFERVTAFTVLDPTCFVASMNSDGTGDLIFAKRCDYFIDENNNSHKKLQNVGFIGILDVSSATNVLRGASLNSLPSDDLQLLPDPEIEESDPMIACVRSYLQARQERMVWTGRQNLNMFRTLPLSPLLVFKALIAYMALVFCVSLFCLEIGAAVVSTILLANMAGIYRCCMAEWEQIKLNEDSLAYVVSDKGLHVCSLGGWSSETYFEPDDVSVIETHELSDRWAAESAPGDRAGRALTALTSRRSGHVTIYPISLSLSFSHSLSLSLPFSLSFFPLSLSLSLTLSLSLSLALTAGPAT